MRRQRHRQVSAGPRASVPTFEEHIKQMFLPAKVQSRVETFADWFKSRFNRSKYMPHHGKQESIRRHRQDVRNRDPEHRSTKKWRRKMRIFAARLYTTPVEHLTHEQYNAACEWIDKPENMHIDIERWPQDKLKA